MFEIVGADEKDVAEDDDEVSFCVGEVDFLASEYSGWRRCGGDLIIIVGDE